MRIHPQWTESEGCRWTAPAGSDLFLEVAAIGDSFDWAIHRRKSRTGYTVVVVGDDPLSTLDEAKSAAVDALAKVAEAEAKIAALDAAEAGEVGK